MKLVRIDHIRCSERAATTWCLAPDGWGDREIRDALAKARTAYTEALGTAAQEKAAPPLIVDGATITFSPYGPPRYDDFPDRLTVGRVKEIWEHHRPIHKAWQERATTTRQRFSVFLEQEGFVSLWEMRSYKDAYEIDWGHRHGQVIGYDDTKLDDWPTPKEFADALEHVRDEDPL